MWGAIDDRFYSGIIEDDLTLIYNKLYIIINECTVFPAGLKNDINVQMYICKGGVVHTPSGEGR